VTDCIGVVPFDSCGATVAVRREPDGVARRILARSADREGREALAADTGGGLHESCPSQGLAPQAAAHPPGVRHPPGLCIALATVGAPIEAALRPLRGHAEHYI
jgi:hypothetical protein